MRFILNSILKNLLEGHFLRKVLDTIDRLLGTIARFFYVYTQRTDYNKVFFYTKENQYSCNPKYICEELLRRNPDCQIVWSTNDGKRGDIPAQCRVVERDSADFYKEIFTSRVIVTNSVLFTNNPFKLRKDQIVIQTWHGSLGFKKIGKDEHKSSFRFIKSAIRSAKMTDCCITNSEFENKVMRDTYWPDTKLLMYGHPRNDIFFEDYKEKTTDIKARFYKDHNLPDNCKLVLYAPTFRDNNSFSAYNIDIDRVLKSLKERFTGEWYLLVRYHQVYREFYKKDSCLSGKRVIDVTMYPDIQELLSIIDVGITDYSSWILDYCLSRKPGFLFATDIEHYNQERGFYYPLDESPFTVAKNNEELEKNIKEFNEESYIEKVNHFLADKGCIEDGHASERTVDYLLSLLKY